jgi:hypothetical protein
VSAHAFKFSLWREAVSKSHMFVFNNKTHNFKKSLTISAKNILL